MQEILSTKIKASPFVKLGKLSQQCFDRIDLDVRGLITRAKQAQDFLDYADSWVVDLTEISQEVLNRNHELRWAGTPSYRANNQKGAIARLAPQKCNMSQLNDAYHDKAKDWVGDSYTLDYFRKFGSLGKVSLAALRPGGWWPSHYDFGFDHGIKINVVLTTSSESKTIVWNKVSHQLEKCTMLQGEVWFLNVTMKHSAHNWGKQERLHLLLTYKDANILSYENFN